MFIKFVHAVSVENNFLRFGKGLDKFVILTKMCFSSAHKVSRSYTPSFQPKLEKRSEDDDDDDDDDETRVNVVDVQIWQKLLMKLIF